ncbi:MAG: pyridoxal-phosphate dependent enzyme [Candidatus Kariarchaeaceae archaeon]|jgi:cystathionine beta-synthase
MKENVDPPEIVDSIVDTIGNTPMVYLSTFDHIQGKFFGKLESFNPGRSSKDRIGITIIDDAEKNGLLPRGGTVVEATSGNTGLGLALVAIQRGYKVILVMPDKMSPEKMNLVKAIGCEVNVCPAEVHPDDPKSYYSVAKRIAAETKDAFLANQYYNPANPLAHYQSTGPEIWKQTEGRITHFVAGVGTGGTISGVAKYLKEQNPEVKIIGIDPEGSILAHYHKYRNMNVEARSYRVEGVGEDMIPGTVDFDIIDDMVTVDDQESFEWARKLAQKDGILLGGSSGLAAAGAAKYFQKYHLDEESFAVILFPDTGERYLGKVFSDSWLRAHGFLPPPTTIREILEAKPAHLLPLICVKPDQNLLAALEKIRKFRINQLIVEGDPPMLLQKVKLFDRLLTGSSSSDQIQSLELEGLHSIDINLTMSELIYALVNHGIVLITEENTLKGVLTKQDIIDNMAI